MQKKKYLKVKRSKSGLGLFTEREISRGDFVMTYTGERITPDEADRRGGKYLFTVSKKLVLDGKDRKHIGRYINHSCRPNCYAEIDEDERNVHIYAKRHIKAGEEITYNYGKEYWDEYIGPKRCRCEKCEKRRRRR